MSSYVSSEEDSEYSDGETIGSRDTDSECDSDLESISTDSFIDNTEYDDSDLIGFESHDEDEADDTPSIPARGGLVRLQNTINRYDRILRPRRS